MTAATLALALAMAWLHPALAPCVRFVRREPTTVGSSLQRVTLAAPRESGPWEIFAPPGSRAALAYRKRPSGRRSSLFDDEIPDDGHVLYGGPPALTIPNSWARQSFFVRVFSTRTSRGCIRAAPVSYVLRNEPGHVPLYLYFGLLGGTALTMFALFVMSGEPFIGWYLAYLCSLILYQLFRNDILWRLGWPFGPWHSGEIEYVLWGPNVAFYAQFARSFLQTARYARRIDRLLIFCIVALLGYLPVVVLIRHLTAVDLNPQSVVPIALMLAVSVLVVAATIGRARSGYRPARYFLLSYPILLLFVCIAVWQYIVGVHSGIGLYGAEIGTGSECILLAFAIGDRLRLERTLGRVLSALDTIVVRVGRDGCVRYATSNVESLLGRTSEALLGKHIAEITSIREGALATKLARVAIRAESAGRAVCELTLRDRYGTEKRFVANLYVERDTSQAITEIQVALQPAPAENTAFERSPRAVSPNAMVRLSVYRGLLAVDSATIGVTGREIEVLVYLALHSAPVPSGQIAAALWPDRDAHAASSALQTTISRLRKKLPPDSIVASRRLYALGAAMRSDLDELQAAVRAENIEELQRLRPLVVGTIPTTLRHREWFADFETWLESIRRDALLQLGEALLASGDPSASLGIAEDLRRLDPCDESGYLLAVRALLASDDQVGVQRMYADCRHALKRGLGLAPSPQFEQFCRQAGAMERL
ncbi:MAG: 7TM diverse intracellular signaling domain-containing protein [Candidatus Baltobacteraceae bacterium]